MLQEHPLSTGEFCRTFVSPAKCQVGKEGPPSGKQVYFLLPDLIRGVYQLQG